MAATFDPALPAALDRMRLALGDTNTGAAKPAGADPLQLPVDNAIYTGLLAYHGQDERAATVALADALIARYSQEPTKAALDGLESAEWAARLRGWETLAARLRAEVSADQARTARAASGSGLTVLTQRASGLGRNEYRAERRDDGVW